MDLRNSSWPFRPVHITNDGESRGLVGTGIVSNRRLLAFQIDISARTQLPTGIFEFARNGEVVSADSVVGQVPNCPACTAFRRSPLYEQEEPSLKSLGMPVLDGAALCRLVDAAHASVFFGLGEGELSVKVVQQRVAESIVLQSQHYNAGGPPAEVLAEGGHVVLSYDCPLLGVRNLMVPVVVEGRVLGALLAGQLVASGREERVSAQMLQLAQRIERLAALAQWPQPGRISKHVRQETARRVQKAFKETLTGEHVGSREPTAVLSLVVDAVDDLERFLQTQLQYQRTNYVLRHVTEELRIFAEGNAPDLVEREPGQGLARLWTKVEEALDRLTKCFATANGTAF